MRKPIHNEQSDEVGVFIKDNDINDIKGVMVVMKILKITERRNGVKLIFSFKSVSTQQSIMLLRLTSKVFVQWKLLPPFLNCCIDKNFFNIKSLFISFIISIKCFNVKVRIMSLNYLDFYLFLLERQKYETKSYWTYHIPTFWHKLLPNFVISVENWMEILCAQKLKLESSMIGKSNY
jgi:hypothetical protein